MTILKIPQQSEETAIVLEKILKIEKTSFYTGVGDYTFLIEITLGNDVRAILSYNTSEERDIVYNKILNCYTEIKEL